MGVQWNKVAQIGENWGGFYERGTELLGCIKGGEIS